MSQLPIDILMEGGHLTDIAAATLADGEEALVPREVREHAHACAACSALVRGEALASVQAGDLVRIATTAEREAEAPVTTTAGSPWMAAAAGLMLATIGAVLSATSGSFTPLDRLRDARAFGVVVGRSLRAAFRADLPPAVTFSATALLLVLALVVMRASPVSRKVISS